MRLEADKRTITEGNTPLNVSNILPPFLFSLHIRLGQSRTLLPLTKFVEKNMKVHNMKSILLDAL